jgi:hypothetical protein
MNARENSRGCSPGVHGRRVLRRHRPRSLRTLRRTVQRQLRQTGRGTPKPEGAEQRYELKLPYIVNNKIARFIY